MKIKPFLKTILGFGLLFGFCHAAFADAKWFKNETQCDGYKIKISSLCTENPDVSFNSECGSQQLHIQDALGKKIVMNLLSKETLDNWRIASAMRCIKTSGKSYLHFVLDNGGSCVGCEVEAMVDMRGKWVRHDRYFFGTAREKQQINAATKNFRKIEVFWITNTKIDEEYPID